jgi:hypothetical protein
LSASGKKAVSEPQKKDGFIYRKLGRTGMTLPVVSMGVMNADNENLVRAALDSGIFLLDTAHYYQRGRNEEMIGRVIKGRPRDSFAVATKVPAGEGFLEKFNLSLKRLGLDYVDIFYVHDVGSRNAVLAEESLKNLESAKKSGKARFVGVSTHSNEPEVVRAVAESKVHDAVLTAYNFKKKNLDELDAAIAEAARAGKGIVAMKTQAGRFWDKLRTRPINMKAALKWALNNPNITTAIPGMTTFDQLELDLTVMKDLDLSDEEKKDLQVQETAGGGLYCQQCDTCLAQCPRGLPIPSLMRGYMYAQSYRNLGEAYDLVASLHLPENPCRDCSACSVRCVSGFDIKNRVTDIARLTAVPEEFLA